MIKNKERVVREGEVEVALPYEIIYDKDEEFGVIYFNGELVDSIGVPVDVYSLDEAEKIFTNAVLDGGMYFYGYLPEDWK